MPPSWPQLRYSLYAPIYDLFAGRFARQRQRSLRLAGPGAQDRVLLVGAGTGLDLPELRACGEVLATDISPAMLARCHHVVRIPTRFCINLAVAGAIVMYDRMLSLGRFAPRPVHSGAPDAPAPAHVHGRFKRFRREAEDRQDAFTAERE